MIVRPPLPLSPFSFLKAIFSICLPPSLTFFPAWNNFNQSYCGEFVASLCPDDGCPDSAGDYDVKFPEPAGGLSSDGYVVRVADTEDESDVGCSDEWRLVASKEVPLEGEHGEPVLGVVLPSRGDDVVAGDEYTVKVRVCRRGGRGG